MVWREPRNQFNDSYFCITITNGFSGKSKHKIENPNISSALRSICHDDSVPVPEQPEHYTLHSEPESEEVSPESETSARKDRDFSAYSTVQPHLITQAESKDQVRDFVFPKNQGSAMWITVSVVEPSRKGCESVIL